MWFSANKHGIEVVQVMHKNLTRTLSGFINFPAHCNKFLPLESLEDDPLRSSRKQCDARDVGSGSWTRKLLPSVLVEDVHVFDAVEATTQREVGHPSSLLATLTSEGHLTHD